jgi:ABC-type uncharacterized transport system ATPase component
MRNKPTYRTVKRDYIRFSEKDHDVARREFESAYNTAMTKYKAALLDIKNKPDLSRAQKKELKAEARDELDRAIRKFDLTKQILLLDEHTAALDPKTAKKVLELTDKIVKENQMTTLMITHNMKDAITYGNRLIMFHTGHIIFDVRGEEKAKLTVEDLLKKFDEADKKAIEM